MQVAAWNRSYQVYFRNPMQGPVGLPPSLCAFADGDRTGPNMSELKNMLDFPRVSRGFPEVALHPLILRQTQMEVS